MKSENIFSLAKKINNDEEKTNEIDSPIVSKFDHWKSIEAALVEIKIMKINLLKIFFKGQ